MTVCYHPIDISGALKSVTYLNSHLGRNRSGLGRQACSCFNDLRLSDVSVQAPPSSKTKSTLTLFKNLNECLDTGICQRRLTTDKVCAIGSLDLTYI